jgi:hypothetical protein
MNAGHLPFGENVGSKSCPELVSLRRTPDSRNSKSVYCRGVDYLLRTQQADGVWRITTRSLGFQPYFQSGFPDDHDQ